MDMPIYGMHTKSGGRLIGQMVCLGNLSFSSFIHQQHPPKLIYMNLKPAVSMGARMDPNISIGMSAIWMVPINTYRSTEVYSHLHPTFRYLAYPPASHPLSGGPPPTLRHLPHS